ncbi:hypothetical protein ACLI5Y_17325 [Enterococcus innesii]|uniref:hypothetical protein n=1 Tax=Enterococcus TaxID=1350 RepID=UPI000789B97B|nr:hypothetical protein [Enterococcus pernyi]
MADLLKKKNNLDNSKNQFTPEQPVGREKIFATTENKTKSNETTGIRVDKKVSQSLKALKTLDNADSVSEVIQQMIYDREKNMTADQRREFEIIRNYTK